MTRKRFVKLMMAMGLQRNRAEDFLAEAKDSCSSELSNFQILGASIASSFHTIHICAYLPEGCRVRVMKDKVLFFPNALQSYLMFNKPINNNNKEANCNE